MPTLVTQSVGPASSALLPAAPNPIASRVTAVVPTQAVLIEASRNQAQHTATKAAESHKEKPVQREARPESPFGSEERPSEEGKTGASRNPNGRIDIKA